LKQMNLAKLGAWELINPYTAHEAAPLARRVEDWGYDTLC